METYVFYEIKCRDETITDTYIGYTKNFNSYKKQQNYLSKNNTNKIYTYIRENGGWSNWDMVIINEQQFLHESQARYYKMSLIEQRKATLNMDITYLTPILCISTSKKLLKQRQLFSKIYGNIEEQENELDF